MKIFKKIVLIVILLRNEIIAFCGKVAKQFHCSKNTCFSSTDSRRPKQLYNIKPYKTQAFCCGLIATLILANSVLANVPEISESHDSSENENLAYILIAGESGRVLSELNADEKRSPASLTKIMLLLLVSGEINSGRLSVTDEVIASSHASSIGGSVIWLEAGESMSVSELIKAVVISSANDAAVALAEHISGSEEAFVQLMNQKASALRMTSTNFANATGLDNPLHFTTARDIALMSRALMREENYTHFAEYALTRLCSVRAGTPKEAQLLNTNKLIGEYEGIEGLKTGTTDAAGYCLVAVATREELRLVSVVLGAKDEEDRLTKSQELLDYGFSEYEIFTPASGEDLSEVRLPVEKGIIREIAVSEQPFKSIVIPKGRAGDVSYELYLPEEITAPIEANQPVGIVSAILDGEILQESYIIAEIEVARLTFGRVLVTMIRSFFGA
ncbi:MAG: D-alanyl-D-alanine carboxypeptidase [Oscillospiraceae bacterium]|nr:D-alanyl-D-alanine carboxypeptidase [Oscillospiraceae bacterium]